MSQSGIRVACLADHGISFLVTSSSDIEIYHFVALSLKFRKKNHYLIEFFKLKLVALSFELYN